MGFVSLCEKFGMFAKRFCGGWIAAIALSGIRTGPNCGSGAPYWPQYCVKWLHDRPIEFLVQKAETEVEMCVIGG